MNTTNLNETSHRRYNILTKEWVLVSPHRTKRPWQGKRETRTPIPNKKYDEHCYLCPDNERAGGVKNPDYKDTYIFQNDFAALLQNEAKNKNEGLLKAEVEKGICKVVCFSPDHSLTLALMEIKAIEKVITLWQNEYKKLGKLEQINYIQIFENKGSMMGCSNPHPHGQIWAQETIPNEIIKKSNTQKAYFEKKGVSLLSDYLKQELTVNKRVIFENKHFVALVPYWAVWPYETMLIPKKHHPHINCLSNEEKTSFAEAIKKITTRYDNLFNCSFPYSAGIHQAPTNTQPQDFWHFHFSFYPPLLRSATVKKFMVGYEMFATPQRDITAEQACKKLKECSEIHYSKNQDNNSL